MAAVGAVEVEIVKPRIDRRDYRRIVLKNSLQVLLISDPETDKCAASMNVNVGSFCDPGLEGLAHFLEHMLFYASEKYPLEDSYSKYINEHGGSTNAFTASDHTNYFFDVNSDSFEEALDRFAQFFINPLMSDDATTREIKAVDSENQKNLLSDGWRMIQLQKHLSAQDHPYHKFSTGSWDTLEVRPKAKGLDTREELIKFYDNHYSANLMLLVIYAKESLDDIQSLVEDKFQEIRNNDRSNFCFPGQPCTEEHLQILVRSVPIKQGHKLRISWPITPGILHYKEGPCRYLGHLIGHEGEGSLFHVLKTLGWATGLSAGEGDWTVEFSFFNVVIDLTDAGQEHMQDIVGLLFKYIHLLQKSGVCQWIFDELAAVCETVFHYQDKSPPIDYVVEVSTNMQMYPPKDWLVGSSLPSNFNPGVIQNFLDQLSPNNVRIFWESKKFEGQTSMVEPWYGTAYSIEKVTGSMIQEWMLSSPNETLHLPEPNVFIPTDLSLKDAPEKVKFPVLLRKTSYSTLWYKPDTNFFTPKAYLKLDFSCPYASSSPEAEVLAVIFTRLLTDYLNEYAYYAQVAGLYYGINNTDSGFQVTVVGYNHKLRTLLETVIGKFSNFEVNPDRFSVIKEMVMKEYENYKFQQPYQQAMYYCSLILQDQTWPWMEKLEVIPHLQAEDLSKFVPAMLSRAFIECYVAGNIESRESESIIEHIEDVFFKRPNAICQPLFPSQHLPNRIVKLEKGMNYFYPIEGLNPKDENSALVHYIQVHQDDFVLNVKLQLFALVAKQPAFHQLRSVEQLGYITVLMQRNDSGIRGVQIIIQSTEKGPGHLDLRVQAFLKMFETKLYEMTSDEFKNNVNALIDMKLEKHKNLREECGFYWREISDGTLKFDRREREVAALRQLSKEELIDFFNEHVKVGAARKRTLSVRVYGSAHTSEYTSDKSKPVSTNPVEIGDIFGFRRSKPLYGSFKGGAGPSHTCSPSHTCTHFSSPVPIKSPPMAVNFSDLHAESGLKSLDEFLSGKSYISGDSITKDDIKVYVAVLEKPGGAYPNASKWYEAVSAQLASSFPGKAVGVRFGGSTADAPVQAKEAASAAAAGDEDDDDLDLFGDETEEEKKAAEDREKAKKDSGKKKESGKSSVLMDVKPWDDETDMKKLEEAVRSVELPGLLWGASKLVAVGYGIKKLHIMMTIIDDLVSVDDLIEDYLTAEPRSEYIQSCDIVAFNKI